MRKKQIQTFPSTGSAVGSIICEDWLFGVLLSLGRKINNNHLYHMQTVASFNSLTYFCSVLGFCLEVPLLLKMVCKEHQKKSPLNF